MPEIEIVSLLPPTIASAPPSAGAAGERAGISPDPSWKLEAVEKLKGDRAGTDSIRINGQRRICLRRTPAGPDDVEIAINYH